MRIAICEDHDADAEHLMSMLNAYLCEHNVEAQIDRYGSADEFVSMYAPGRYQIIFMDIVMPGSMTGMDGAKKIHEMDEDASIVFTTVNDEYSVEGYNVAVYYILKPINSHCIEQAMYKCRKHMDRLSKAMEVMVNREMTMVRLQDIRYIEAHKRTCMIACEEPVITYATLEDMYRKVGGFPFVRCHRSYIVNLNHVRTISSNMFAMKDGQEVFIGRTYKQEAKKQFDRFLLAKLQGEI